MHNIRIYIYAILRYNYTLKCINTFENCSGEKVWHRKYGIVPPHWLSLSHVHARSLSLHTDLYRYIHKYTHAYTYISAWRWWVSFSPRTLSCHTHTHIYTHTYIRTYIQTHIRTYLRIGVGELLAANIAANIIVSYTHVNVHTRTYVHTNIYTYIKTFIPAYRGGWALRREQYRGIHIRICTHTYIHIHRKSSLYLPITSVNLVLKLMGTPDGISTRSGWNRVSRWWCRVSPGIYILSWLKL